MIYLDSSVVLAYLFGETRGPDAELFDAPVVSSRLLEYEVWNRVNARGLTVSHGDAAHALLQRVALLELAQPILYRALTPFPIAVRTLGALHLASIAYLRDQQQSVSLASYDTRMLHAAQTMRIPIVTL